jgi:hypothetical protein
VFNAIDRLNGPASATAGATVVIGLKARKPSGPPGVEGGAVTDPGAAVARTGPPG